MRALRGLVVGAATLGWIGCAAAQTSLFDQAPVGGTPQATTPAPAPAPAAKPRPKPRGPAPARALSISNGSGAMLVGLVVSADGREARLAAGLADGATATLRLPAFKTCMVTVTATFDGTAEAEQIQQDICRDRSLRITGADG